MPPEDDRHGLHIPATVRHAISELEAADLVVSKMIERACPVGVATYHGYRGQLR